MSGKQITHRYTLLNMLQARTAASSKNAVSANIKHSIDTSIKHPISGLSTPMVKGCIYIMLDIAETAFSY